MQFTWCQSSQFHKQVLDHTRFEPHLKRLFQQASNSLSYLTVHPDYPKAAHFRLFQPPLHRHTGLTSRPCFGIPQHTAHSVIYCILRSTAFTPLSTDSLVYPCQQPSFNQSALRLYTLRHPLLPSDHGRKDSDVRVQGHVQGVLAPCFNMSNGA